ncbi:hypothetical protein TSAR_005628 [Trichomalopsis sarcophagae]|uniref:CHCH domain-containing protein n=1 Tax=Trichomalopsis sarcophagae TaxID=543379 RepID=A0A232F368_9HYME|nr:hypothetical protein TSAR_005628 [Trichomalopsis sarcophagae]
MSSEIDCGNDCPETSNSTQKIRGMDIGKGMQERIKTGKVNEDRITNYEKEWSKKLECIDQAHTKQNGLTISEAEGILRKLRKFADGGTPAACPDYKKRVLSCLKKNKNNSLRCGEEVEAFANCVDEMLLKTGRKDYTGYLRSRKPTYTEKFEQVLA